MVCAGPSTAERFIELARQEQELDAVVTAFYRQTLPALPLLLAGLVFGDGGKLVGPALCSPPVLLGTPLHTWKKPSLWLCGLACQTPPGICVQVHYESSVPVIQTILLSVSAWGATVIAQLYAVRQLTSALFKQAEACTWVGTMVIVLLVGSSTSCPECCCCC